MRTLNGAFAKLSFTYNRKNKMEISGKLNRIGEIQTFNKGFQKREFVIETEGEYPQLIKFELVKDNVDKIDFPIGTFLTVTFDIRGNEWKGKIYNNLVAWRVVAEGDQPHEDFSQAPEEEEDVPF